MKIIKNGEEEQENIDVLECLSLYDYQSKASRYSNGLTYLKTRVTTIKNIQ